MERRSALAAPAAQAPAVGLPVASRSSSLRLGVAVIAASDASGPDAITRADSPFFAQS